MVRYTAQRCASHRSTLCVRWLVDTSETLVVHVVVQCVLEWCDECRCHLSKAVANVGGWFACCVWATVSPQEMNGAVGRSVCDAVSFEGEMGNEL